MGTLTKLATKIPHGVERLLFGGLQGTGHTPDQVVLAQQVLDECVPTEAWTELLSSDLRPGVEATRLHTFDLSTSEIRAGNLIRVNYFPDGGVARMRLWSQPAPVKEAAEEQLVPTPNPVYMPATTGKA